MKLAPLFDKIIVQRQESVKKTPGGIHLPDSAQEKPRQGKVLAIGPGAVNDKGERLPMCVREGQTVLFSAYAGNEVDFEGHKMLILRQDDVLGVVE
jgi:chaperonin GroES